MPVPSDLTTPASSGALQVEIEDAALEIAPNSPFFLVHYDADPGNWFVGEITAGPGIPEEEVGTWWLPKLQAEWNRPGLNLHRTLPRGAVKSAAYTLAHAAVTDSGGNVLPQSLNYCVPYRCVAPITRAEGTYYSDPWSSPRRKLINKTLRFDFDRNRYHRWLLRLLLDGLIEPPMNDVVREIQGRREARIARREAQVEMPEDRRENLVLEATAGAVRIAEAQVPEAEQPVQKVVAKRKPKAPAGET